MFVNLGIFDTLVDLGIEVISSAHLPDIHPARETDFFQSIAKDVHLILTVPLIADEDVRGRGFLLYNVTFLIIAFILKFFNLKKAIFFIKPFVPREPRRDPSNCRICEHGI